MSEDPSGANKTAKANEAISDAEAAAFPIVGVGASAGGLEAFREFLIALPKDPGWAFVFIQHLAPKHDSMMAKLLNKMTELDVVEAEDDTALEPNHVYVIPPDRYIRIENSRIMLDDPVKENGLRLPIDYFFRSLAEQNKERAIAIILTGTGSDGSAGLRDVKGAGGLVIVQQPREAQYDAMPRNAIKTDMVDFVEPIASIPQRIIDFVQHPYIGDGASADRKDPDGAFDIQPVIALLKARSDLDFLPYKRGTLSRRIQRRMSISQLFSVDDYVARLREDPDEIAVLCKDFLVSVTRFFRDGPVWDEVRAHIDNLVAMAAAEKRDLRVWCAGCATGEEAFTLAMLFEEAIDYSGKNVNFSIFSTDLDTDAIAAARTAKYSSNIEQDVPREYLERYFDESDDGYRIRKKLRERVVFAQHNLICDPPFSQLDLVSCRNFLIYIDVPMQSRLLDIFHFALRDKGILLLGKSERFGEKSPLFSTISETHRLLRRSGAKRDQRQMLPFTVSNANRTIHEKRRATASRRETVSDLAERHILSRFAPASALVTPDGEAVYFFGSMQKFLKFPEGEPSTNVIIMAGHDLRLRLKNLLRQAGRTGERQSMDAHHMEDFAGVGRVRVEVEPIERTGEHDALFLISFLELENAPATGKAVAEGQRRDGANASAALVDELESELQATRTDLQTTIEDLESTNEELKASNEEAMSVNEELQSANEELETGREELQSLNEELVTVNAQLEGKVGELEEANDDITNLLSSVDTAVMFLGRNLRIRRFTEPAKDIFNVIESDIGRPVSDLAGKITDDRLIEDARNVLKTLEPQIREVQSRDGERWYSRLVRPYRTCVDRIDGVVITYTEMTEIKKTVTRLEASEKQHKLFAKLGQIAIASSDIQNFFDATCDMVATELDYDCTKILQYRDDSHDFLLVAGHGWRNAEIGKTVVPGLEGSQAGYTLLRRKPVIVEDFAEEERFARPDILGEEDVQSGISCAIGPDEKPWGVVGIHCRKPQQFSKEDANFIQSVANQIYDSVSAIRRESALSEAMKILRVGLDAAEMGIWRWNIEDDRIVWDDKMFALFGIDPCEKMSVERFYSLVHPEDSESQRVAVEKTISSGEPYQQNYRVIHANGETLSLLARGDIVEIGGKAVLIGVAFDVTRQKTLERQYELIARELDHRVKNLMATVVSMSRMMGDSAETVEEFKSLFQARMTSLAKTHGLLSETKWHGAMIETLLREELSPFRKRKSENIHLQGPPVVMDQHAAQCLAMAFHEMTTNAAKYGALSSSAGSVHVEWKIEDTHRERQMIRIQWREVDGPKVKVPSTSGFGAQVINGLLSNQLNAEIDMRYPPTGFECDIAFSARNHTSGAMLDMPEAERSVGLGVRRAGSSGKRLEGRTILVLDDEWFVATALADSLSQAGASVPTPAASLEKAQTLLEKERFDAAVLDYNIAGRPATPFARTLKEMNIPILIVSGYGSGLKLPSDLSHVPIASKPISEKRLIAMLEDLIDGSGPANQG